MKPEGIEVFDGRPTGERLAKRLQRDGVDAAALRPALWRPPASPYALLVLGQEVAGVPRPVRYYRASIGGRIMSLAVTGLQWATPEDVAAVEAARAAGRRSAVVEVAP